MQTALYRFSGGSVIVGLLAAKSRRLGVFMRTISLVVLLATAVMALPVHADDTGPITVKADQIGQVFCISRIGNDDAVIEGLISPDLQKAIAVAEAKDDAWAKQNPDEKPPLGDGLGWQSAPDYADKCDVGLVTLSKSDAKVELKYSYSDYPAANYVDTLILKRIPQEGYDVGFWRIDDVIYPDGTTMKGGLVTAFDGYQ